MNFSDTTNKNGLIQECEILCGLGDAAISGNAVLLKQFTGLINQGYHQTVMKILASQDEWDFDELTATDYPVLTRLLVAGQRDYPIPVSENVLHIKRVDVVYDAVTPLRATPIDAGETTVPFGNDALTDSYFSRMSPQYDIKFNSMWLYPMANAADVTAGGFIRVEVARQITEFASTETTLQPGIEKPWHPMLALDASYMWLLNNQPAKADRVKASLAEMEARLKQYYGSRQVDRRLQMVGTNTNYY